MFEVLKQKYLASFEAKTTDIKAALEQQDVKALTVKIHQLAGSSGSYGLMAIAQLCEEIENLTMDQDHLSEEIKDKTHQLIKLMTNAHQA